MQELIEGTRKHHSQGVRPAVAEVAKTSSLQEVSACSGRDTDAGHTLAPRSLVSKGCLVSEPFAHQVH